MSPSGVGRRRRWPFVLLALGFGVWALHGWIVGRIGNLITESMREETGYPTHIKKMTGVLPLGQFRAQGFDFKTRFGPLDFIHWNIPDLRLDLSVVPFFSKVYVIEALDAQSIEWVFDAQTMGGKVRGDLTVRGDSQSLPPELPADTIWCEHLKFSTLAPTGSINAKDLELPHRTSLSVTPFSLREGEPVLPFEFEFEAQLSSDLLGPRIEATGSQDQKESRFEAEVGAYALDKETVDRILLTALAFDPEMEEARELARKWILDGSYAILLEIQSSPTRVAGDITLRLSKPKFGEDLKNQEFASDQSIRPFLESFEEQIGTIELEGIKFDEDLTTAEMEAWTQLGTSALAAVLKAAPDAAIETGVGLIRNLFKKDREKRRD